MYPNIITKSFLSLLGMTMMLISFGGTLTTGAMAVVGDVFILPFGLGVRLTCDCKSQLLSPLLSAIQQQLVYLERDKHQILHKVALIFSD